MSFDFDKFLDKAVYVEKATKPASEFQKTDMGDPYKLYAYIKSRVESGLSDKGKHQFITTYKGDIGVSLKAFNTPLFWKAEETGDTITVKQFVDGTVKDWETRKVLKPLKFIPTGTVEKAMEVLSDFTSADTYDELPPKGQAFWDERAPGIDKILNQEQPMIEAYARHLWRVDAKAQAISPVWVENVKETNIPKDQQGKVSAIKNRLKQQAMRELNFDRDTL